MIQRIWFTNKGQVVQTVISAIACAIGAVNAWPKLKGDEVLSIGAILFYFLIAIVIVSFVVGVLDVRSTHTREVEIEDLKRRREESALWQRARDDRERKYRQELEQKDAEIAELKAVRSPEVKPIPQLWIQYKAKSQESRQSEAFIFTKDGNGPIRNIKAGPLEWIVSRPISLLNVMGPLRDEPIECKFEQVGAAGVVSELPDLMREMMRTYSPDAQPSITITYEDFEGRSFRRTFELSIDPYDKIACEPGPVEVIPKLI